MTRIPKILHYTFGMARDFGGKPWSLVHHVCLKSAVERIRPDRVLFHCQFEPTGPWWELSREFVTLSQIEAPQEIFGRPLMHVAHQSDVVRLQKLIAHGGIYLDADVLVQKNFDDLLNNSTVLGEEGEGAEYGMANAVILAEPDAPFLRRWLAEYKTFRSRGRDEYWNEHSVQLPVRLAREQAQEITVLPPKALYWPLWTNDHLEWIFRSTNPIPLDGVYANHLWESNAWRFLDDLTPGRVRAVESNFHYWARPFLADLPDSYGAPSLGRRLDKIRYTASKRAAQKITGLKRRARNAVGPVSRAMEKLAQVNLSESEVRRKIFQEVYQRNLWGNDGGSKFFSGVGSRGNAAQIYVQHMAELLGDHARERKRPLTIVDLGCGDFQVGRALLERLPGMNYVGCDIVPELVAHNNAVHGNSRIRFCQLDLVSDTLPQGDVCLVRQVLQHLSNADIQAFFERADYPWIYLTEGHPVLRTGSVNPDKRAGHEVRFDWRTGRGRGVELDMPPFNLATEEMFRAAAPQHEVIITERVFISGKAQPMPSAPVFASARHGR
ncbi:MAG TPA: glycosyltransferase [Rhizomicrobium sp.]|jgi:SAM-dependent methyltransferase|nr:glycosyltransferase [Rhizomicrobium sp.]